MQRQGLLLQRIGSGRRRHECLIRCLSIRPSSESRGCTSLTFRLHPRHMSFWSDLKNQFTDELNKNDEFKKNLEKLKGVPVEEEDLPLDPERKKKMDSTAENIGLHKKQPPNDEARNNPTKDTQDNSEFEKVTGRLRDYGSNARERLASTAKEFGSKTTPLKDKAKELYEDVSEKVQDEAEKVIQDNETIKGATTWASRTKDEVLGNDRVSSFKKWIREGFEEVLHGKAKQPNSTIVVKKEPVEGKDDAQSEDEQMDANSAEGTKTTAGPSALVVVKGQDDPWERITRRLKDTPIIKGILNAAKQAAETKAGKTIGKGAAVTKNKIGDVMEDAREYWETSQNPWVYRMSSIYDGLFGETELALVIKEIRRTDPSFVLEEWKEELGEGAIRDVIGSFLLGETSKLKKWCGEACYNQIAIAIRERKREGLVMDPHILGIRNIEVIGSKLEQSPVILVQFMVQQIHCIKNRNGDIVEGGDDNIQACYYVLAFQRYYDEEHGVLEWKILEMLPVGAIPWV